MTGLWRSFLKAWSLSGLSASLPSKGTSLFAIAETLSRDQGPLGPIEILLSKEQQRGVHFLPALDPSLTVLGFVGCRAVILWNSSVWKISYDLEQETREWKELEFVLSENNLCWDPVSFHPTYSWALLSLPAHPSPDSNHLMSVNSSDTQPVLDLLIRFLLRGKWFIIYVVRELISQYPN